MNRDQKIKKVLPLLFKDVEVPLVAKKQLKERLFDRRALNDDELMFVAAAGDAEIKGVQQKDNSEKDK